MKINIIGAGIAGLTAGCHLQMKGFDTEIFESHTTPGGLCTSWKRGDYTVDGCVNWLMGSNPADPVYKLWNELIDMDKIRFHDHDEFFRVKDRSGKEIIAYTNLEKLRNELIAKAPEDIALANEFIGAARELSRLKMRMDKAPELYSAWEKIVENMHYIPYLKQLIRYGKMTIHDFAIRCKNPLLYRFFEYSFTSEMPVLFIMFTFAWLDKRNAGYPIGGSLAFSRLFERKYLDAGGKIHYGARVAKIPTEQAGGKMRACGVELGDGHFFPSDITVSAADGYATIYKMLEGKYVDDRISHYYKDFYIFPSFLQVSLGVARDYEGIPSTVIFPLEKPFVIDPEKTIEILRYRVMNYDPTLAPKGKTLILCLIKTFNYRYWEFLREQDREQYNLEKRRIADFVIETLDRAVGGVKENLEMVDVSTPATLIRYTGNWKGSVEGWMVTRETGFDSLPKVLPGLDDFFMAGQWVEPGGGIPAVFFSGRNVAQLIARRYRR